MPGEGASPKGRENFHVWSRARGLLNRDNWSTMGATALTGGASAGGVAQTSKVFYSDEPVVGRFGTSSDMPALTLFKFVGCE